MSVFSDEEDNNPFAGSDHLFASGISTGGNGVTNNEESTFLGQGFADENMFGNGAHEESDNGSASTRHTRHTLNEEMEENVVHSTPVRTPVRAHSMVGVTETSPVESPEPWTNYRTGSKIFSDHDGSIVDSDKQQEYERGLVDQANTTISSNNPLDFYSDTETTPYEVLSKHPEALVDIPYIIQLKDRKNKIVVVYIIKLKNLEIRRRYSDFDKLRKTLIRIYPTFFFPSLPEKHSLKNYMKNPLNVQKSDVKFIEHRKRALRAFINRIITYPNFSPEDNELPPVKFNEIFLKFLDPTVASFPEVLKIPPISLLQKNPLLNDPLNPFKISPYHNLLPTPLPSSISNYDQAVKTYKGLLDREKRQAEELGNTRKQALPRNDSDTSLSKLDINADIDLVRFEDYQHFQLVEKCVATVARSLKPVIECEGRIHTTFEQLVQNLSKLGAYLNAFSLEYNFTMTFQPDFQQRSNNDKYDSVPDDDLVRLKHNLTQSQNKDFEQFYTLSLAIEKVGQSIDNEFINIEMLEYSLMISFLEPLAEIHSLVRNSLTEVTKFRKLKDLQYLSINKRLRDKRKILQHYLNIDLKYQQLEQVLKNNLNESNTMKQAYQRLELQKQRQILKERTQSSRNQAFNNINTSNDNLDAPDASLVINEDSLSPPVQMPSNSFHWLNLFTGKGKSPENMTRIQRTQEIKKLKREILTLQHLAVIAANDVQRVSDVVKKNIKGLIDFLRVELTKLNLKFTKIFVKFLKENLSHWEQVDEYINNNIYDLKFNYKYDTRIPRYIRFHNEHPADISASSTAAPKAPADFNLDEEIKKHNSRVTSVNPAAELLGNTRNRILHDLNTFEDEQDDLEHHDNSLNQISALGGLSDGDSDDDAGDDTSNSFLGNAFDDSDSENGISVDRTL